MIILKIALVLFITVVPVEALVKKKLFIMDNIHANIVCPFASLDLGLSKTVTRCAAKCSSDATCKSFFYNEQQQFCKGAAEVLTSTVECNDMPDTVFYQTEVKIGDFYANCSVDSHCTRDKSSCRNGRCSCQVGYIYEPSTGACVTNCTSYGSTYIEYVQMALFVPDVVEYQNVTLSQCKAYCSSSEPYRGFNYIESTGRCKIKHLTLYENLAAFRSYPANHYTRNCA